MENRARTVRAGREQGGQGENIEDKEDRAE